MNITAPLSTPTSSGSRSAYSGRSCSAELGDLGPRSVGGHDDRVDVGVEQDDTVTPYGGAGEIRRSLPDRESRRTRRADRPEPCPCQSATRASSAARWAAVERPGRRRARPSAASTRVRIAGGQSGQLVDVRVRRRLGGPGRDSADGGRARPRSDCVSSWPCGPGPRPPRLQTCSRSGSTSVRTRTRWKRGSRVVPGRPTA